MGGLLLMVPAAVIATATTTILGPDSQSVIPSQKWALVVNVFVNKLFLVLENPALSFHSYHVPELCLGEKQSTHIPPTLFNISICTTHQLTVQFVTWLINCYSGWRLATMSAHAYKRCPLFTEITDVKVSLFFLLPTGLGASWAKN